MTSLMLFHFAVGGGYFRVKTFFSIFSFCEDGLLLWNLKQYFANCKSLGRQYLRNFQPPFEEVVFFSTFVYAKVILVPLGFTVGFITKLYTEWVKELLTSAPNKS